MGAFHAAPPEVAGGDVTVCDIAGRSIAIPGYMVWVAILYAAAGSVITRNVPADALAMTRAELDLREGWAKRFRDIKTRHKTPKAG